MKIIFEDESIVVCIKPEGLLSQSDSAGGESAVLRLRSITGAQIYPVHRLDKTTMGIMVYAKTTWAAAVLSRDIADHRLEKRYVALVHGRPEQPSGQMQDMLFFDRRKNKSFVVKKERSGVKKALLEYTLTDSRNCHSGVVSSLDISLKTGRTHQIRVQCATRQMPLLGDRRYGAQDDFKKIALCAYSLKFRHPVSLEDLVFDIRQSEEYSNWFKFFNVT